MNTTAMRVPCGCKAILSEKDPRAEIWRNVFGCLEFPLCSPMPLMGKAEGELESRFLRGDWSALVKKGMDQKFLAEVFKTIATEKMAQILYDEIARSLKK